MFSGSILDNWRDTGSCIFIYRRKQESVYREIFVVDTAKFDKTSSLHEKNLVLHKGGYI